MYSTVNIFENFNVVVMHFFLKFKTFI